MPLILESAPPVQPTRPEPGEWILLLILAGAQFLHILDFVIMMPLGPQLMRVLSITPQEFGFLVSIYTFSAAVFGFLGVFVIDRFDRKSALLGLTAGFALGTLFCALAPGYAALLAARAAAGACGGLMGAVVFSIIGDAFAESRRGLATGTVMSAFSIASVLGVPFGLFLASHFSWKAPFVMLFVLSAAMTLIAFKSLPSMRKHLANRQSESIGASMRFLLFDSNRLTAYALIVSLMFAAFSVIPFISPYLVRNAGLSETHLPYVYLFGGGATLATSRWVGRLADRLGKPKLFTILATASIVPILLITNLPPVSFVTAIAVTTVFTVLISSRSIPAMSMITSSVESRRRGGFMSFTTCVQQMASGLASLLSGVMIVEGADGRLHRYDWVGVIAVVATLISLVLANRLKAVDDGDGRSASPSRSPKAM